jgi:ferredoxin
MALWLPINGYVALAMPFCHHGGADMSAHETMSAADHSGMAHHADPDSGAEHVAGLSVSTDPTGSGLACNDCGVCHLACSPLLMSEAISFKPTGHNVFDVQVQPSPHSFSPEQPQRPPRTAL